jgi:hypothetical protein
MPAAEPSLSPLRLGLRTFWIPVFSGMAEGLAFALNIE